MSKFTGRASLFGGRWGGRDIVAALQWRGLEPLESRILLDGSPFATGVITPTGGSPTVVAGPGGLDGTPSMDLNSDGMGDMIARFPVGGSIGGAAFNDVISILSDGVAPTTGTQRWTEYRIARYANPIAIVSVTTGDLNNDGLTDVVVQVTASSSASSERSINLYLSHPDGTFTSGQTITLGSLPRGANLSIFDATGDGVNDLFQQTDGKITVYKGMGDGTVATPGVVTQIPISSSNGLDFSKDLTGDGIPDIAISGVSNDGFASAFIGVYKGNASGSYTSANLPIPAGFGSLTTLQFLALENLDANPALDIIALGSPSLLPGSPATLFVFRNNGTGTFTQSFSSGSLANGLYTPLNSDASKLLPFVVGDIDNDGATDMAVMEGNLLSNDITIRIERNNGNAGFSESQAIPVTAFPNTSRILLIDIDDDGFDDLVVHHDKATGGKVTTVYFSQGDGTFGAGLDVDHGLNSASNARIADFNNDGRLDLQFHTYADFVTGFSLTVMLNSGETFAAPVTTNLGTVAVPQEGGGIPSNFPTFPVRDYDGDGVPDIIGNSSGGQVGDRPLGLTVIKGAPDGSFTFLEPSLIYNINNNATGAAIVADFNVDGKPDLLLGTNSTGSIGVTTVINGAPLPADTAGNDQNSPRQLGALTNRITVIEHVSADANADARDRFDWYRFSVDSDVTVRSAVIPLVAPVAIRTARLDGIGTGNDFPSGLEPVFIDKQLTAGSWHTSTDKFSNSETDYRLDIFVPAAGPDIGVYQGLDQRISGQGTLDYGTLKKNTTDTRRTLLVRNDGLSTLNFTAIQFPAGYSIADSNGLALTLDPGASDYVTIRLDTSAAGTFNGNIIIPSNDADTPSFVIPVSATVEDQGPIPQPLIAVLQGQATLTSGQTVVSFGTATQGTPQPLQKTFTIRNDGNANLTLGVPQMPAGFVLSEPLAPLTLTPNQSETFTVSVGTADVGTFSGNITFTHNSGGSASTFSTPVSAVVLQSGGGGDQLPDLVGENREILLGNVAVSAGHPLLPGDKFTTTVRVFNTGIEELAAANGSVRFFASTDLVLDDADQVIQTLAAKFPKLAGGAFADLTFGLQLPSGFDPGTFRLIALLDSGEVIAESDETNNAALSGPTMVVVQQAGQVGDRANVKLTVQEDDGTLVTFTLAGGGTLTATQDPTSGAFDLAIADATSKSALTITTKPGATGGDNTVVLRNISINAGSPGSGIGKITATTATLTGALDSPGGAAGIVLMAVDGGTISLGTPTGVTSPTATLALGRVHNANLTSAFLIKSLSVVNWIDDDQTPDIITTPGITALNVTGAKKPALIAGDFQADITGPGDSGATLGSAKIAGSLNGAAINLAGASGAITIASDAGTTDAPVEIQAESLKGLTINGNAQALTLNLTQAFNAALPKLSNMPKLTIKGTVDELNLTSAGSVGAIATGAMSASSIRIGVLPAVVGMPTAEADFISNPGAALAKLTVTGGYTSSIVAATNITSLALPAPTTDNAGIDFGVVSAAIKAGKLGSLKLVDADRDGSIDPLTDGDFELRIV